MALALLLLSEGPYRIRDPDKNFIFRKNRLHAEVQLHFSQWQMRTADRELNALIPEFLEKGPQLFHGGEVDK